MSRFLCLYISDFPAWAAACREPHLRDKPLIIYSRGRVIAASPLAHQSGIQMGWSLARAEALVPDVVALPEHPAKTSVAWEEVIESLREITPCIESVRPGLAFASLTANPRISTAAKNRDQIRDRPRDRTSDCPDACTTSESATLKSAIVALLRRWHEEAGLAHGSVADDRTTAHLAALTSEPGTLRSVKPGRSKAFLRYVSTGYLSQIGVSADTVERLGWFGFSTAAHLQRLTKRQLIAQFAEGELLYRIAQVNDVRPVARHLPPPSISACYGFEEAVSEPGEWEPVLRQLVEETHSGLDNRLVQSITISIATRTGWHRQRRLLREPVNSLSSLWLATQHGVATLLQNIQPSKTVKPRVHPGSDTPEVDAGEAPSGTDKIQISAIEVRLDGLIPPKPVQNHLFEGGYSDATHRQSARQPSLSDLLKSVEARFPGALRRIVMTHPDSYVPEEGFHYAPIDAPLDCTPVTRSITPLKPSTHKPRAHTPPTNRLHPNLEVAR